MEWAVSDWGYTMASDLDLVEPVDEVQFWGGPISLDWEAGGRTRNRSVPDRYLPDAEEEVKKGPWIVTDQPHAKRSMREIYDPMKVRTLHREFAALQNTPEAVLAFATRYGLLGGIGCHALIDTPPNWQLPKYPTYVESVEVWYLFCRDVARLVSLWDQSKDESLAKQAWKPVVAESLRIMKKKLDREGISHVGFGEEDERYFRWAFFSGKGSAKQSDYAMDHIQVGPGGPILLPSLRYSEVAKIALDEELNLMLATWVRPTIAIEPGSTVMLRPRNLLGAIYALLAEEIIGASRPLKKCPGCGKWFQPLDIRKMACSDRCRQRAWRMKSKKDKTNA